MNFYQNPEIPEFYLILKSATVLRGKSTSSSYNSLNKSKAKDDFGFPMGHECRVRDFLRYHVNSLNYFP